MGIGLPVPNYSTACKRQRSLDLKLKRHATPGKEPRHVVIDTTGLKVFGAGGWYVRKPGAGRGRRRTWRKLHLGVDVATKEIVAVDVTESGVHDSPHLPSVLAQVADAIDQISGDRAYDSGTCYAAILARDATPTIPPRRNARPSRAKDPPPHRLARDALLRRIEEEGRFEWRSSSGATRQSLAENAVSRFKALMGVKLALRDFERQQVEALVKSHVLNRMTALGMPKSERISVG